MKKIEIRISKDGQVKIKTEGYVGGSCQDITKNLQNALGVTTNDKQTDEYYQTEENRQTEYQQ